MCNAALAGRMVIVARPSARRGTLGRRLQELGAQVMDYPCVEMVPLCPCPALDAELGRLDTYLWAAFSGPEGAELFCKAMAERGLILPEQMQLAAIGPATAKVLERCGFAVALVPPVFDGAHLGAALAGCTPGPVLLIRGEEPLPGFDPALAAAGTDCTQLPVYRTVYRSPQAGALRQHLQEQGEGLVALTSLAALEGFVHSLGPELDSTRLTAVCMGPKIAERAHFYGIRTITAEIPTFDALIDTIRRI